MSTITCNMTRNDFEFQIDKYTIQGQYYSPEKIQAVVVLVHGMGEYARRYERTVVPALLKESIAVVSFDQFGHGHSSGKKGHQQGFNYLLDAVEQTIVKAQTLYPSQRIFLYGHSMGGNVVINYALRRTNALKGLIVTSPFLRLAFKPPAFKMIFGKLIDQVFPSLTMPNELDLESLSKDQKEIEAYKNDPLVHDRVSTSYSLRLIETGEWALKNTSRLHTPMILIHGAKDRITSYEASKEFAKHAGDHATFVTVENGFHELHHDLEKEQVLGQICEWIKKQITKP